MDNEYFTSQLIDIGVGYECELKSNGKWERHTLNSIDLRENSVGTYDGSSYWITVDSIRTPYLTKEQIEAEGWKNGQDNIFLKNRHFLIRYDPHLIEIRNSGSPSISNARFFLGKCPSINELRYISKLLEI